MILRFTRNIVRRSRIFVNKQIARAKGIEFSPPNYIYLPVFNRDSIVVDVGCADDPDLATHLISRYGLKAYGVDPTRKHTPALLAVQSRLGDRFEHLPLAVGNQIGELTFYESQDNVSGSLLKEHSNVQNDEVVSYTVEVTTIPALVENYKLESIDLLKLDLEGAEYSLLDEIDATSLASIQQLFVEFHHHCIPQHTIADTKRVVQHIERQGYRSFSLDNHNYLFYRVKS